MNKLLAGINRFALDRLSVIDWDAAVRRSFARYVRRRSILHRHRELFRAELVNLARIQPFPDYTQLLSQLVRSYRSAVYRHRGETLAFLVDCAEEIARSDERWLSLALTYEHLSSGYPLYERVFQAFGVLDTILEGCYKPHLRVLFGFTTKRQTGSFPADIRKRDLGSLLAAIPEAYKPRGHLLVQDAVHRIPVNQWRNIAAHKSFSLKTRSTIEVRYGHTNPVVKRLTYASLNRTLEWALRCLATARLATTIVCIEYMPELKAAGLPDLPLRLESLLVMLCHNLHIVGFQCIGFGGEQRSFVLRLRDKLNREPLEAVIHASQVLDQIAVGLEFDATRSTRYDFVAVRLFADDETYVGGASIPVRDAIAATKRLLSLQERLACTKFDFADQERLQRALAKHGFPGRG